MSVSTDSIVALSTPPGRGGIGVIRISGPEALAILRKLTKITNDPEPNYMTLRVLSDPSSGETLDQAFVCYFKGPRSFTGEDVVEFHCHGSPVLLRRIIDTALLLNARLANPGEFSLRAVMNGRMQLAQAEAIRDLIQAQTDAAAQQATRQLSGEISHRLQPIKDQLLKIIVRLESSLEFVEDDLPEVEQDQMRKSLQGLRENLDSLAKTFSRGRLLHDGLKIAFVGRPNVGKSSLFNSLLGHGRAIVTDIPGTTRDTISEPIAVDGVPVTLVDTAGIRASQDAVEAMGVERSRRAASDADLLVVVIDGSQPVTDEDESLVRSVTGKPHVIALNKNDLRSFSGTQGTERFSADAMVSVSAVTGAGLADLTGAMLKPFQNGGADAEGLVITSARHHDLLLRASQAIAASEELVHANASEEIILVGLHNALRFVGQITGEASTEEILGQIFSTFCIGK